MTELKLEGVVELGARGKQAKRVQEWLSLHGIGVVPDGKFGPATDGAVREFQRREKLTIDGEVGPKTWERLVAPMAYVLEEIPAKASLGATVVAYGKRHLKQGPREIGGQNCGPWVRLYMDGNEGAPWAWCAGFACFLLRQACETMDVEMPITPSVSCDSLAASAKREGLFLAERGLDRARLRPGAFFLNRNTPTDWTHVGIVLEPGEETFQTIEGNTNDEGSREGYEVCQRVRGYKKKDFIDISD